MSWYQSYQVCIQISKTEICCERVAIHYYILLLVQNYDKIFEGPLWGPDPSAWLLGYCYRDVNRHNSHIKAGNKMGKDRKRQICRRRDRLVLTPKSLEHQRKPDKSHPRSSWAPGCRRFSVNFRITPKRTFNPIMHAKRIIYVPKPRPV